MKSFRRRTVVHIATVAILAASTICFADETRSTSVLSNSETSVNVTSAGLLSIIAANQTVDRIAAQLSEKSKSSVRARGTTALLTVPAFIMRDVTLQEAVERLADSLPGTIVYQPADKPGTYELWDSKSYRSEVLRGSARPKVFMPKHITAENVVNMIEDMVTPGVGSIAYDERANKVFVSDMPEAIERMEVLVEHIDIALITRVFSIKHADVEDLADQLESLQSPAASHIIADTRTRQVIVKDRLDKLREMEMLVHTLDIVVGGTASDDATVQ